MVRSSSPDSRSDSQASSSGSDQEQAPAQWIDEDELDELVDSEEDEFEGERRLHKDYATLSFGTLARATQKLNPQQGAVPSGSSNAPEPSRDDEPQKAERKKVKRNDKHAPMEVSSKRPVTKRREVVTVPKIELRDPRFSDLSGQYQPDAFGHSYEFISELQQEEASTLRKNLSLARKLYQNSPAHLREERGEEITRLEHALKRLESNVERAKREQRARAVLKDAKKEERAKVEKGKKVWHMKESEKQELIRKARYDELAAAGRGALQKAITKRKLKIAQKEKRSRPYDARPSGQSFGRPGKRPRMER